MLGIHDLLLFIGSGILLNITPGPDTFYVIGRAAGQGWRTGALAALGITAGCLVHITCAALGLSAVLATSATAFTVLKYAGAAYLVYVGVQMLRQENGQAKAEGRKLAPAGPRAVLVQGFFTNALNPKVALFFLAFLPQFVDRGAAHPPLAFLVLGSIFATTGCLWLMIVARTAARLGSGLRGSSRWGAWFRRCTAGMFVFLGIRLALAER